MERDIDKPGSKALENMKLLENESRIFKTPKIPLRKAKSNVTVLEEDTYVEGISRIIQRDFFPDLEKLNAQNDFLEATELNDHRKLRELYSKYSSGRRPPADARASPATFETPGADRPFTPTPDETVSQPQTPNSLNTPQKLNTESDVNISKHTLDSYLASHTSEDNDSFDQLTTAEEIKRSRRAFGPSVAAIENAAADKLNASLALPSIESQADQTERPLELDMWSYRAKNYIMYVPDGHISPGDIRPKPELQYHNTRLKQQPFDPEKDRHTITEIAKSQMRSKDGRIEPDGTRVGPVSEQEMGFVSTPSPRPGHDGDESPLMTWGEIDGTPFRLDAGDTPLPGGGAGSGYHMLEMGSRERLALRLAEKRRPTPVVSHTPLNTPYPRTPGGIRDRLMQMSPAARRFATSASLISPLVSLGKPSTPRTGSAKAATPKTGFSQVVTPKSGARKPSTPLVKPLTPRRNAEHPTGAKTRNDLTDDLLQINLPKRSRQSAADFFR